MFSFLASQLNIVTAVLLGSSTLLVLFYQLIWRNWNYFKVRNVPFNRGVPVLGSLYKMFVGKESFADVMLNFYKQFPDQRFFGLYEFLHPVYVVRDPELVKQITITDFEHFVNHQGNFEYERGSLIARTLFFDKGQHWKDMRSILSPAFTGNKMRLMFGLVNDSSKQFMKSMNADAEKSPRGTDYECKDLFSRFACNVIATCAFGLNVDALANREDDFFLAGKNVTNFDGWQGIKFLLFDSVPQLMRLFRVKFFEQRIADYFRSVVNSTVSYREKNNVFRPDMIHLLMQARQGTLNEGSSPKVQKGMPNTAVPKFKRLMKLNLFQTGMTTT